MADLADILFIDPINERQIPLSFAELVSLVKGSSIKSMALADDFLELGITDAANLRIEGSFRILLFSTLNKGENPPLRLQILATDETPTARTVEQRIHSLRQLYALSFLINAGRSGEAAKLLEQNPNADLEVALKPNEHLLISAAGEGSFWLTVLAKTKTAFKNLNYIAPLFFEEGRQAIVERVRAGTELKQLEVKEKEINLSFQGANKLIDLVQKVEKIKDTGTRERVRLALSTNAQALGQHLPPALPAPRATMKSKEKTSGKKPKKRSPKNSKEKSEKKSKKKS